MARKLGSAQRLALLALNEWPASWAPPTPDELATSIARKAGSSYRKPTSEAEAMAGTLRRLEGRHLVRRLGKSFGNAWCWAITNEGRKVLEEAESG